MVSLTVKGHGGTGFVLSELVTKLDASTARGNPSGVKFHEMTAHDERDLQG